MKKIFVIVNAFVLTILIFALAILINYGLDFYRIDGILDVMNEQDLKTQSYLVENDFSETFNINNCYKNQQRLLSLKEDINQVGIGLTTYGSLSSFSKSDFNYLRRKYFLLELDFFNMANTLNKKCESNYIPLLFFYELDDPISERQGYILEDIEKSHNQIFTLSFDIDYKNEPLLDLLKSKYNITKSPSIIFNDEKIEGLSYTGELNKTIIKALNDVDYYSDYDFNYVVNAAGIDKKLFVKNYKDIIKNISEKNISDFAKGDIHLMMGRLTNNDSMICKSLIYYDKIINEKSSKYSNELKAITYETIASIGCGRNKRVFYFEAANLWKNISDFRYKVDMELADGEKTISYNFSLDQLSPAPLFLGDTVTLGNSYFVINSSTKILSQVDRVYRDWLGVHLSQSPEKGKLLNVFSEETWLNSSELLSEVGWHEGGRLKNLEYTNYTLYTGYGTLAKKINNKWYAPNEKGIFMFEVPLDKILYPTTRFLRKDFALLIDTHGINMLVDQAIRNDVDLVIGCCDHPGKIKAANYLSKKGISVICPPDKFSYLALGHNTKLFGSPPITFKKDHAVIGNRTIILDDKIVAMNSTNLPYAVWYYQTPTAYFKELSKYAKLNITYVKVNSFKQMVKIINKAEEINASIIAVRIYDSNDYYHVKHWLDKDPDHRAILFHSTPYPYGMKLYDEYPLQTSFGDVNPI